MSNKVNVINKAGENINVNVNQEDGITEIIISLLSQEKKLGGLEPGDVFVVNGTEYIVCDHFSCEATAVVRKNCLDKRMPFGPNNNWFYSDVRTYLYSEYLPELVNAFGEENIMAHSTNLLSMDGFKDYGIVDDVVSVLTFDQYRLYHTYIGDTDIPYWLATPNQTPSRNDASYVQFVDSGGYVDCSGCCWDGCGVRPFFLLKSNISV